MYTRLYQFAVAMFICLLLVIPVAAADVPSIISDSAYPNITLAEVQAKSLPNFPIADDHGILFGGIGSDIYRMPNAPAGEFWTLTDRGPNSEVVIDGQTRYTFVVPEYTPTIARVQVANGVVTPIEYIAITTASGKPVTGLPNISGYDAAAYDGIGTTKLEFNPNGIDSEGLVRTRNGEFWIVDEYTPSLLHLSAKGRVITRYIPTGVALVGADYPVVEVFPTVYSKRKANRGFEGLTISPDEQTIFIALQSPLSNPDKDTGDRSRTSRILKFDVKTSKVTGEYAYRQEIGALFNPRPKIKQTDMKLSGLAAIDANTLLVLERTDWAFEIYKVDLSRATNILGSVWDDKNAPIALEFFADPADVNVSALPKELILSSSSLSGLPDKIEGITIVDDTTLAIANDNDFDVGTIDATGKNTGKNTKSRILTIHVPSLGTK